MLFHETARGRKSPLGEAIRTAHDLQKKIQPLIPIYIFEAPGSVTLLVQTFPPPLGFTYLMIDTAGTVLFIHGMDSMIGPNASAVLEWIRHAYDDEEKT